MAPASAQDVKPLVRAISSDVNSLDPHDTRGAVDQDIMLNIYEKLVEMEFKEQKDGTFLADPMGVVPNLAESWIIEGPKTIFKLRKDVKFYPTGNPMTADDVIYSFTRLTAFPANGKNQAGVARHLYAGPDQEDRRLTRSKSPILTARTESPPKWPCGSHPSSFCSSQFSIQSK